MRLTTMMLLRGGPINHFRNPYAITPDKYVRTIAPLRGSSFGMSYSATSNLSSFTAQQRKPEQTVYLEASKMSVAPSAVICVKTIAAPNLSDSYLSPKLMVLSEKTQR
jgi:hypothetical protein